MIIFSLVIVFYETQVNVSFIHKNKILYQNILYYSDIIFMNLLFQD